MVKPSWVSRPVAGASAAKWWPAKPAEKGKGVEIGENDTPGANRGIDPD